VIGEIIDLGVNGEMGKKRVFDDWLDEEVVDVSVGRGGICVGSGNKNVSTDLGLVDGFIVGGNSDIGLGDKESVIRIVEGGVEVGFNFEDQLTVRMGGDFESLTEFKVGIAEGKFYMRIGDDTLVGERTGSVGGNPRFN